MKDLFEKITSQYQNIELINTMKMTVKGLAKVLQSKEIDFSELYQKLGITTPLCIQY